MKLILKDRFGFTKEIEFNWDFDPKNIVRYPILKPIRIGDHWNYSIAETVELRFKWNGNVENGIMVLEEIDYE